MKIVFNNKIKRSKHKIEDKKKLLFTKTTVYLIKKNN